MSLYHKEQHQDKDNIDKVKMYSININFMICNSKQLIITANSNTSSIQATLVVPYKVDLDSNGKIMLFHIFLKLYPRSKKLAAVKNENTKLRTYNSMTITQLGRCTVRIENNNKIKMYSVFVGPRNRQPLLGMPDIETLDIMTITCNTMEMKEADGPENCKTSMSQETEASEENYTHTDNISKFEN